MPYNNIMLRQRYHRTSSIWSRLGPKRRAVVPRVGAVSARTAPSQRRVVSSSARRLEGGKDDAGQAATALAMMMMSASAAATLLLRHSRQEKASCEARNESESTRSNSTTSTAATTTATINHNIDSLSATARNNTTSMSNLRLCGRWCATATDPETTPCRIDRRLMPCKGRYCQTTAALWKMSMLGPPEERRVSCDTYKAGMAYPKGGVPCDARCLVPEVNPRRYPLPTGVGVLCRPGTCRPAASPWHDARSDLGILQCPCNWFGSECTDTVQPLQRLRKTTIAAGGGGEGRLVRLQLWIRDPHNRILADDRPGSVVRLQHVVHNDNRTSDNNMDDKSSSAPPRPLPPQVFEMACAVAHRERQADDKTTTLVEVVLTQPSPDLHPHVRQLTERLRALPDGTHEIATATTSSFSSTTGTAEDPADFLRKVYANPVISGFYNSHYQFLMDHLHDNVRVRSADEANAISGHNTSSIDSECTSGTTPMEAVAVVADTAPTLPPPVKNVVFVATGSGLAGVISAIVALLANPAMADLRIHVYYGVQHASEMPYMDRWVDWTVRDKLRLTVVESKGQASHALEEGGKKFYVQHAVARDVEDGVLQVDESIWVACGHLAVLDAVREMLPKNLRDTRLFLNI